MICGRIPQSTPVGDFWGEMAKLGTKVGAGAARGVADYLDPAAKAQVPTQQPVYAPPVYTPPPPAPAPAKKDNTMLLVLAALFLLSEKSK